MPDENERNALAKIKNYLDSGHNLDDVRDDVREAGWASWMDNQVAKGYELRHGRRAVESPRETPPSPRVRSPAISVDFALLCAVMVVAALPRLVLLGDIPPGLHGDEAVAVIEANRIIDSGHIGAHSPLALGVPAGSFYWTALVFGVLDQSVFTVRLSFALLGVATVGLSFLAFRVMFDRPTATIAALLLAGSAWHIHYSRIAFIPISLPLAEMATVLFLFLALRYQSKLWFAASGAALGAGLYTYQVFPIFAGGLAIVVVWLAVMHYRDVILKFVSQIAVMLGVALLVGLPMASFAYDFPEAYLNRGRNYSKPETFGYEDANVFQLGLVLAEREVDYIRSFIDRPPQRDGVDAAGIMPFVNRVNLGLIIVGGAIALWRFRRPEYATVLILTGALALAAVWADGAWYRRTVGITPFLALIAALPLALVWKEASARGASVMVGATLFAALIVGGSAALDVTRYFTTYDDHPFAEDVFRANLLVAYEFIDGLPEDTYINFYSRHSFVARTQPFLATEAEGADRSGPFGSELNPRPDPTLDHAFVFLGGYIGRADEVAELYPGGERVDGGEDFQAYLLPRSVEPAPVRSFRDDVPGTP